MSYYYSNSNKGIYSDAVHGDSVPSDAVKLDTGQYKTLIEMVSNGFEVVIDSGTIHYEEKTSKLSKNDYISASRKYAYADPLTGSDPLFSEAYRMQLMGEAGWEIVRDKAIGRYKDIKDGLPWATE